MLEPSLKVLYTNSMKNKNNKTANELVNLIIDVQRKQGNADTAYAYATGVLIAIMDWSCNSSNKNALQDEINREYNYYSDVLVA